MKLSRENRTPQKPRNPHARDVLSETPPVDFLVFNPEHDLPPDFISKIVRRKEDLERFKQLSWGEYVTLVGDSLRCFPAERDHLQYAERYSAAAKNRIPALLGGLLAAPDVEQWLSQDVHEDTGDLIAALAVYDPTNVPREMMGNINAVYKTSEKLFKAGLNLAGLNLLTSLRIYFPKQADTVGIVVSRHLEELLTRVSSVPFTGKQAAVLAKILILLPSARDQISVRPDDLKKLDAQRKKYVRGADEEDRFSRSDDGQGSTFIFSKNLIPALRLSFYLGVLTASRATLQDNGVVRLEFPAPPPSPTQTLPDRLAL